MGYDLFRGSTFTPDGELDGWIEPSYTANVSGWAWLIEQAQDRGWEPAGTLPPARWAGKGQEWNGSYGVNDGQWVTAEDAAAWATALEQGWPYPDETERWNGLVREFINYCRSGGFEVW